MGKTVLAFDLYGTLLSTESIANQLAANFGANTAKSIAASWRRYQLEYTWRLNSMELYEPFSTVTRNSLTHALSEHGVALDSEATDKLMDAYNHLSAFPEVPAALDRVASDPTLAAVVFSNGTLDMVSSSVLKSQDLAPYSRVFDDMICVEAVQRFKPTRAVYGYLAERLGKEDMSEIWLITANPFDVVGAVHAGIKAAWVDRAGRGWIDAMDPDTKPTVVAADVNGALDAIQRALGK